MTVSIPLAECLQSRETNKAQIFIFFNTDSFITGLQYFTVGQDLVNHTNFMMYQKTHCQCQWLSLRYTVNRLEQLTYQESISHYTEFKQLFSQPLISSLELMKRAAFCSLTLPSGVLIKAFTGFCVQFHPPSKLMLLTVSRIKVTATSAMDRNLLHVLP